ncbi:hypothetical protein O181_040469 [Austropuccinia psidii MF-1]|uniref:Uncharacterized protein n=1 Tax=Austropuccinia psidii MF-1 TaxID=1389203 RepID=A0A9Q3HFJ7_9BASI|nr:hypothetical protein [Austropuccinia psidii MF-1]
MTLILRCGRFKFNLRPSSSDGRDNADLLRPTSPSSYSITRNSLPKFNMVLGKLRMKNTEPNLNGAQSFKPHRRRHKTRSPSIDPEVFAPKGHPDGVPTGTPSASHSFKGKQKDHGNDRCREDDDFRLKLQDALEADNDDIRFESLLQDDLYLPRRWQDHQSRAHALGDLNGHRLGQLESEEYEEYVRKRMWSRTHRTHYLYTKEQEERQKIEHEKAQQARKKQKLEAKKRAEQAALKESKRILKEQQRCRNTYYQRWEIINAILLSNDSDHQPDQTEFKSALDDAARRIIDFEEIPWPVYSCGPDACFPQLSSHIDQLNSSSIQQFLIGHLEAQDLAFKKKILRTALLSYHPDRFDRLVGKVKNTGQGPQKAKEWGLRVSQVLNELNSTLS